MTWLLVVACAWAAAATAIALAGRYQVRLINQNHVEKVELINKVGKWHEGRVEELENETRQLAAQLVAVGNVPLHAMPILPPEEYVEYAYDATGLVREKLDARDLPVS